MFRLISTSTCGLPTSNHCINDRIKCIGKMKYETKERNLLAFCIYEYMYATLLCSLNLNPRRRADEVGRARALDDDTPKCSNHGCPCKTTMHDN